MKRIICIGNRYISGDSAGAAVFEHLMRSSIPNYVEVIDGGLGGLNLLKFLDGAEIVVFVDNVFLPENPNEILILKSTEVIENAETRYDHAAGISYLIQVLPYVLKDNIPDIFLIGINAKHNQGMIEKVASLALKTVAMCK